jgi:mannitol-specific phosphotransferase system IIBC component
MAGEEREDARRWAFRIAAGVATLLVVYVLSTGPVVGWTIRRQLSSNDLTDEQVKRQFEMIVSFYAPLIAVYDRSPPFADAIDWYVDL